MSNYGKYMKSFKPNTPAKILFVKAGCGRHVNDEP
jgi:hypothetical protein